MLRIERAAWSGASSSCSRHMAKSSRKIRKVSEPFPVGVLDPAEFALWLTPDCDAEEPSPAREVAAATVSVKKRARHRDSDLKTERGRKRFLAKTEFYFKKDNASLTTLTADPYIDRYWHFLDKEHSPLEEFRKGDTPTLFKLCILLSQVLIQVVQT